MTKCTVKVVFVVLAVLLASVLSHAQQPTRVHRIGLPWTGQPEASTLQLIEAFRQELRNLGYVDGQKPILVQADEVIR